MITISRICSPAPLRGRITKVCMWGEVPDIITPVKFDVDRFKGFWSLGVYKSGFSIDKASRPYNSSAYRADCDPSNCIWNTAVSLLLCVIIFWQFTVSHLWWNQIHCSLQKQHGERFKHVDIQTDSWYTICMLANTKRSNRRKNQCKKLFSL